jgi:hypothetical protein
MLFLPIRTASYVPPLCVIFKMLILKEISGKTSSMDGCERRQLMEYYKKG